MADHSEQPSCGRPFICISCEQLEYLIDLNFTAVSIAGILGVSRSTVYRRFKDYGLSIRNKYSSISDEMLDEIVQKILQQYPDCGQKMMSGHLKERGIVVQQEIPCVELILREQTYERGSPCTDDSIMSTLLLNYGT